MYNQFFNRVSDISSANQQRLTDSLRPIVFWMQILGNDFSISQQCWTLKRYCGIVYGIAVLAIMEVSAYVITISYSNISQTNTTSMTNWLRLIVDFQWKFWDFVFPLTMFYATSFNWKRLWNQARKMAKYFNYPVDFYEQLRKVITTSILSIIVLDITAEFMDNRFSKILKYWRAGRWLKSLSLTGLCIINLYECFSVVLFLSMTWLASMSLQVIMEEVRSSFPPSGGYALPLPLKWKQSYHLISNYIREIDRFFATFLLVFVVKGFLYCFTVSCELIVFMNSLDSARFYIYELFRNTSLNGLVIFGSYNMKKKVSGLAEELTKRRYFYATIKSEVSKVDELITNIYGNPPRVSPMRMFDIAPSLILQLVETTVTYLLVMAQFTFS